MHKRLRGINGRQVTQILNYFGFHQERSAGSHHQWLKETAARLFRVTVNPNAKSFPLGTLRSMIRQSGFLENDWVSALDEI